MSSCFPVVPNQDLSLGQANIGSKEMIEYIRVRVLLGPKTGESEGTYKL